MQAERLIRALVVVLLGIAACDDALPPSPARVAATDESRLALRLERHLATVPGVAGAGVLLHLPPADPFARAGAPTVPARAAIVVTTAAGADSGVIGDAALAAARTLLGADADVQVQITPPPPPSPPMVQVGPFRVAAASRGPLIAILATALVAIAALAAGLAWALYRRGINPHQSSASTTRGS